MRLYIPALDIQKLNPSLIEKYYLKQTEASLIFSTEELGRWDSLLMTELIRLIDYGAKQGIQVDITTL